MDDDDSLHRLEGISDQKGGLIVKKKPPTFKVPQPSLLGLDKLAAAKRREKEDAARKMSFSIDDEDNRSEDQSLTKDKHAKGSRKFRAPNIETPTYTGGITEAARERLLERLASNKNKEKGVYASSKDLKRSRNDDYTHGHNYQRYSRDKYDYKRDRYHSKDSKRERDKERSSRDIKTPRFKDEPQTPNLKVKDEVSKSAWDDDDPVPAKRSSWDFPTPSSYKGSGDWSERSTKSRKNDSEESSRKSSRNYKDEKQSKYKNETPRVTPAHKYNAWMKDRKKTGATPGVGNDEDLKWNDEDDKELWEEEQKRIDREWYNMDEGMHNIFILIIEN